MSGSRAMWGGKARSVNVPGTGRDGRPDLPGEHGFRFFPGFYKHITNTMKRIPYGDNKQGVFDNLVTSERVLLARFGRPPLPTLVNFPKSMTSCSRAGRGCCFLPAPCT